MTTWSNTIVAMLQFREVFLGRHYSATPKFTALDSIWAKTSRAASILANILVKPYLSRKGIAE
jgi:hypothetical protein